MRIKHGRGRWREVRYRQGDPRDARGLGLDEMLEAIAADRPHRASGRLALHVLDVATSALRSAEEGRTLDVLRRYPVAAA